MRGADKISRCLGTLKAYFASFGMALLFLALASSPVWAVTISHGPRIGLVTQTTATIYWDTDTAALGSVKWGATTSYGSTLSETSSVTNHRLTITGLAAATTYHYKVSASTASSVDYTFTTAVPSGTDFTFISMADSRGSSATNDLAGLPQAFINIVSKAAAKNAGFALFGGDMFYGSSTQTTQASLYDVWKTATDPLAHNLSLLVAVGNHEMNEAASDYSTITQFNQEFAQPQTNPSGYPGTVFSFDWGNSHFAIVDTCHVNTSTNCSGGTNNCMYYMFDDMLTWLDSDLAAAQSRGVRHIFVMGHSHAYADSSWTLNYMGNYPTQRDKFWSILVNRKVDAYLCGHIHDFNDALGQQGVVQWLNGNSGASTTNNAYTLWNIHGDTATATLYDDSGNQVTQLVIQSSQPTTCTSPTVSVTAPAGGSTVSGNVTLTASVSGSPAATQVVFKVDGTAVATLTASPWSYSWNSASVANGSHSITAAATNTCGTTTSAAVAVTVSNTAPTYSISGTVTTGGTGLSGVLVSTGSSTVTTAADGTYTISGLANGTYTVTPTKSGYTFSPTSTSVTISNANKTGVNFTGTATSGDTPLTSGVSASTGSIALGAYKYYTIVVPSGATNLSITLTGLTADLDLYCNNSTTHPTTSSYYGRSWNSGTTSESLSYTSPTVATWCIGVYGYAAGSGTVTATVTTGTTTYSISGTVSGAVSSGVTMTLSGAASKTTTTGTGGTYTFSSLANGTYTVTPSLSGYAFSPTSSSVTISGANKSGINFTASSTGCGAIVVISQVFGGGGNSGAYYNSDFIELFNRGGQAQSLVGWSVQYASASGTTWSVTALSGSIPAGGYYLIKEYAGSTGTALPTADATGTINMSATSGKVALVNLATALTGSCPTGGGIQDFVGYGAANCYEGSAAAPALTSTTSAQRAGQGCTDTNGNGGDFTAVTSGTSNPAHNSASAHKTCACS